MARDTRNDSRCVSAKRANAGSILGPQPIMARAARDMKWFRLMMAAGPTVT